MADHPVLTFKQVRSALERVRDGFEVESTGPLVEALVQLGCFPYAQVPCTFDLNCKLSISGKPAGTFEKPDIDLILQESTPSSFGRGETTVLDTTYRSGKEIPAQKINFIAQPSYRYSWTSEEEIAAAMFVGKSVKVNFYKLAVYEEGGHLDWHMDTTHSDQHHATFLLALNTTWEGGDLKLRRNGVETVLDMHPKADRKGGIDLQAIAFYTDTEHKVEPVTKGIRIVLQYDVEVVGSGQPLTDEEDGEEVLFENIEAISIIRKRYQKSSDALTADNEIITKITNIITGLANGDEEVGFAMQHLYRKSSILPEFLKGADAQLYRALVGSFDITLRPIILHSFCNYKCQIESFRAIPWDNNLGKFDSDSESESDAGSTKNAAGDLPQNVTFHLPLISSIREISRQAFVEHTGNEALPAEKKYFGGGMFVRQKKIE
jgi:hypothetical protein